MTNYIIAIIVFLSILLVCFLIRFFQRLKVNMEMHPFECFIGKGYQSPTLILRYGNHTKILHNVTSKPFKCVIEVKDKKNPDILIRKTATIKMVSKHDVLGRGDNAFKSTRPYNNIVVYTSKGFINPEKIVNWRPSGILWYKFINNCLKQHWYNTQFISFWDDKVHKL